MLELCCLTLLQFPSILPERKQLKPTANSLPYATEIIAAKPKVTYTPKPVADYDPFALITTDHIDRIADEMNLPQKNFNGIVIKKHAQLQKIIFSIQVATDSFRRRIHPTSPRKIANHHIALLGCSFTFGDAINYEDTLGANLEKLLPQYTSYNLGFVGYGPNDVLARSLKYNFLEDIQPQQGAALYIYTDNQIKRSAGAMSVVGDWGAYGASLEELNTYTFSFKGPRATVEYLRTKILSAFWSSSIVQLFRIDWPFQMTPKHYDRLAREIKSIEILYKRKTHEQNPFIVVIYPHDMIETDTGLLKTALAKHNIIVIDYSQIPIQFRIPEKVGIDHDGHPSSEANRHLAQLLQNDLKNYLK